MNIGVYNGTAYLLPFATTSSDLVGLLSGGELPVGVFSRPAPEGKLSSELAHQLLTDVADAYHLPAPRPLWELVPPSFFLDVSLRSRSLGEVFSKLGANAEWDRFWWKALLDADGIKVDDAAHHLLTDTAEEFLISLHVPGPTLGPGPVHAGGASLIELLSSLPEVTFRRVYIDKVVRALFERECLDPVEYLLERSKSGLLSRVVGNLLHQQQVGAHNRRLRLIASLYGRSGCSLENLDLREEEIPILIDYTRNAWSRGDGAFDRPRSLAWGKNTILKNPSLPEQALLFLKYGGLDAAETAFFRLVRAATSGGDISGECKQLLGVLRRSRPVYGLKGFSLALRSLCDCAWVSPEARGKILISMMDSPLIKEMDPFDDPPVAWWVDNDSVVRIMRKPSGRIRLGGWLASLRRPIRVDAEVAQRFLPQLVAENLRKDLVGLEYWIRSFGGRVEREENNAREDANQPDR